MKHTKGPWKNWGDGDVISAKGNSIARVLLPYAKSSHTHQHSPIKVAQREANAHLIASAPLMFEFIRSLIEAETNPLIAEHARRVIAKAEGRGE